MNLIGEEFIPPKEEKTKKTSKILDTHSFNRSGKTNDKKINIIAIK